MAEKTNMTKEWADRVVADNPVEVLPNGNIRVFCRLAFANVLERGKPAQGKTEGSFGTVALLPDGMDLSVLQRAVVDLIKENQPAALANQAMADKLNKPIKKQDGFINTKSETGELYDGFVNGRYCISANSGNQPPAVDQRMAPIVDKAKCYSGVWAFVTLAPKWFDVGTNKGPTFYLQSVMVVADDLSLGGTGSANPNEDFKGVKVDPSVNPAAAFGAEGHTAGGEAATAASLFD